MNKSKIDYLREAERLIGRLGYTLNIITGCKHGCEYCYARRMVEHGFLKGNKAYPYGFEPTFHPERVKAICGKKKLFLLNNMGDVGGDWGWRFISNRAVKYDPITISIEILRFAELNPQHIILLLTKNPAWYRFQEWPENCYCGFSATTNLELVLRYGEIAKHVEPNRIWVSLEPWLDKDSPQIHRDDLWIVIGGLTGKDARPVSRATMDWLGKPFDGKRFVKTNAYKNLHGLDTEQLHEGINFHDLRQYPDEWRVK